MKKGLPLVILFALSACASAPKYNGPRVPLKANPSAIVAAELAFARLAREKGQWTSFRETMTREAVMFVPERVLAAEWLKGRADPATAVTWQPHQVWSSCDGSIGVSHGAWQGMNGQGYFTTAWQRQPDGSYKWMMDHGVPLDTPLAAPEAISAKVADCKGAPYIPISIPAEGVDFRLGISKDQSLQWESMVNPDLSRTISVRVWNGSDFDTVLIDKVPAPEKAEAAASE